MLFGVILVMSESRRPITNAVFCCLLLAMTATAIFLTWLQLRRDEPDVAAQEAAGIASLLKAQPQPYLSPAQVVRIQLAALKINDADDKGISVCFRFASPANRSQTGPLPRFAELVRSPQYRVMLNHRNARIGPVTVENNIAQLPVHLIGTTGEEVVYIFMLSRQKQGENVGCWMTDGVITVPNLRPQPSHDSDGIVI